MEILVVLYFIDLTFGTIGQGSVSLLDLAKWFLVSKPTAFAFMQKMVNDGLVKEHEISTKRGHGFVYKYTITQVGKQMLDDHYQAAYQLYRVQVARVIEAIQSKNQGHEDYTLLTAKEKRQIAAGQKELFSND